MRLLHAAWQQAEDETGIAESWPWPDIYTCHAKAFNLNMSIKPNKTVANKLLAVIILRTSLIIRAL